MSTGRGVPFAIVHHANQYLISDGYENREGLAAALGSIDARRGILWILELHRKYEIPAHVHLSGTLLEAIAWHFPDVLNQVKQLCQEGTIELVGSCYGQNIMRFFEPGYNLAQLNEQLHLYKLHLGIDPQRVKTFWPPERVWDTERMSGVLAHPQLHNGGYEFVLIDDRVFLRLDGPLSPRQLYDRDPRWDPDLFRACRISHSGGLIGLPLAQHLRVRLPPDSEEDWRSLEAQAGWLSSIPNGAGDGLIAIYGDDMEKVAGMAAWGAHGPARFERLLRWLREQPFLRAVRISEWATGARIDSEKPLDIGTFRELAKDYDAGEGFENWYGDAAWAECRNHIDWTEARVNELAKAGADPALLELARKHLLASNWETGWHTPAFGPFGDSRFAGQISPWIKALASHSRHAAVIAEAAFWMHHRDGQAHAVLCDLDHDGELELVLKNDTLFAVFAPNWGGRLIALFALDGPQGAMLIGNPSDDWNWQEELNKYMEVPPNHPGALADRGHLHDRYGVAVQTVGQEVRAILTNQQPGSRAAGLVKTLSLSGAAGELRVDYVLPDGCGPLAIEFGLSPDYLALLRHGSDLLRERQQGAARHWTCGAASVWITPQDRGCVWTDVSHPSIAHRRSIALTAEANTFTIRIGGSSRPAAN
jgi:starch synthase